MKPVRCSLAAVVRRADGRFLVVQQPPDDDRLPSVWGFPAVTLLPGELPEAGLRRVGTEKLGVELEPTRFAGISSADREEYQLIPMDVEARVGGGEPDVHAARTSITRYVDQRWTDDPFVLHEAARKGSLCSQIFLAEVGRSS